MFRHIFLTFGLTIRFIWWAQLNFDMELLRMSLSLKRKFIHAFLFDTILENTVSVWKVNTEV